MISFNQLKKTGLALRVMKSDATSSAYFAIGYCGSGVTRSTYLARQLSRRILGSGDHRTAFDDLPFESKPFYKLHLIGILSANVINSKSLCYI